MIKSDACEYLEDVGQLLVGDRAPGEEPCEVVTIDQIVVGDVLAKKGAAGRELEQQRAQAPHVQHARGDQRLERGIFGPPRNLGCVITRGARLRKGGDNAVRSGCAAVGFGLILGG